MAEEIDGGKIAERIGQWRRELESWNIEGLSIQRQEILIGELNHLYSKGVELVNPDAAALVFGDFPNPYLGGLFIGDPAAAERVFARIGSRGANT